MTTTQQLSEGHGQTIAVGALTTTIYFSTDSKRCGWRLTVGYRNQNGARCFDDYTLVKAGTNSLQVRNERRPEADAIAQAIIDRTYVVVGVE